MGARSLSVGAGSKTGQKGAVPELGRGFGQGARPPGPGKTVSRCSPVTRERGGWGAAAEPRCQSPRGRPSWPSEPQAEAAGRREGSEKLRAYPPPAPPCSSPSREPPAQPCSPDSCQHCHQVPLSTHVRPSLFSAGSAAAYLGCRPSGHGGRGA